MNAVFFSSSDPLHIKQFTAISPFASCRPFVRRCGRHACQPQSISSIRTVCPSFRSCSDSSKSARSEGVIFEKSGSHARTRRRRSSYESPCSASGRVLYIVKISCFCTVMMITFLPIRLLVSCASLSSSPDIMRETERQSWMPYIGMMASFSRYSITGRRPCLSR